MCDVRSYQVNMHYYAVYNVPRIRDRRAKRHGELELATINHHANTETMFARARVPANHENKGEQSSVTIPLFGHPVLCNRRQNYCGIGLRKAWAAIYMIVIVSNYIYLEFETMKINLSTDKCKRTSSKQI